VFILILGIDAGNFKTKVVGKNGLMEFISAIGESRDVNLQQIHGEDDMVFEYEGRRGFAGSLALYESEFGGSIMGDSKAHPDTKIRVLIAIHRYCTLYNLNDNVFQIILGQPIVNHTPADKEFLKQMLCGQHSITLNGVEKTFAITHCEIAAEGATSYFSNPQRGLVRIIDLGSGTCNYATLMEGRFIDKDSGTLTFGMNTNKTNDMFALSRGIVTNISKKWGKNDHVLIVGGAAEQLQPLIKEYFPNTHVLYPVYNNQYVSPVFANAVAFYNIAVNIYE